LKRLRFDVIVKAPIPDPDNAGVGNVHVNFTLGINIYIQCFLLHKK